MLPAQCQHLERVEQTKMFMAQDMHVEHYLDHLWGKRMVSYVPQVREEQMVRICLCVHVCVAPPMIVGVWSMAVNAMVLSTTISRKCPIHIYMYVHVYIHVCTCTCIYYLAILPSNVHV